MVSQLGGPEWPLWCALAAADRSIVLFVLVLGVDNPSADQGGILDRADYLGFTFNPFVEGRTQNFKTMAVEAYCVKCKAKRDMKDAAEVTMANGRKAMKGTCPTCGTGMFKIMRKA